MAQRVDRKWWPRRICYIATLAAFGLVVTRRWPAFIGGQPTTCDALRRDLESVKDELAALRQALQAASSAASLAGPDDVGSNDALARIKTSMDDLVALLASSKAAFSHGFLPQEQEAAAAGLPHPLSAGSDAAFMFPVRYALEQELKRIYQASVTREEAILLESVAHVKLTGSDLVRVVRSARILPDEAGVAIEYLWRITSDAVHGEAVTSTQREFVEQVSSQMFGLLRRFVPPGPAW